MARSSTDKIGSAIASARPSVMHSREIYTGTELGRTSSRDGAYDALAIPSLIGGKRVTRAQQREDLRAPVPASVPTTARPPTRVTVPEGATAAPIACAPPCAAPDAPQPAPGPAPRPLRNKAGKARTLRSYLPQAGSVPDRVIQHLRAHGGSLTHKQIAELTGVPAGHVTAICKTPLLRGALVRQVVDGRVVITLPHAAPTPQPVTVHHTSGRVGAIPATSERRFWPVPDAAPDLDAAQVRIAQQLCEAAQHLARVAAMFAQAMQAAADARRNPSPLSSQ